MNEELLDPRHLPRSYSPSTIFTEDQRLFVADATLLDNGWLSARRWDQSRVKLPPHVVFRVERAEVESTGKNQAETVGLVDENALEEARRLAQPTVKKSGGQEAIADD